MQNQQTAALEYNRLYHPDFLKQRDNPSAYAPMQICWNILAEIVEIHCSKGTKLLISGKLKNNNYEKNGKKVYSNEIVIDSLEFLETKKQDD